IARGAHLEAMRKEGLRVESKIMGDFVLPQVTVTDRPETIGPVDFVLMATKAYDLEAAAKSLLPILKEDSLVLPLLNGVDIAERCAAIVGPHRVLGGMCRLSSSIKAPGVIAQVGPLNRIIFGELAGGVSPRAQAVLDVFKQAGIGVELSAQIQVEIWKKFMSICASAGMSALTRTTLGPVLKDPETRAMFVGCLEEVELLARRKEVALPATIVQETVIGYDKLPPEMCPSMCLSVLQGQPLEVEALNGTAARLGRELGIPTPINKFIYTALKLVAEGKK
ncbi:MAG: 2-dehydropantoate 2-reductase, partial [Pseudomonadota bacterium]